MLLVTKRFGVAALAGLAVCGALPSPAHAQMRPRPGTTTVVTPAPVVNPFLNPFFGQNRVVPFMPSLAAQSINRNPYLNEYTTLGQAAYNTAVLGQALSNIPPYYLGYNPYPQSIYTGPSFPTYGGSTLTTAGYNPYTGSTLATNPYGGASLYAGAYGGSPGLGGYGGYGGGYGGYGGYLDPYLAASNPYNGYLRGAADVTTANANYQMIIQQARLVREQANQSHLQTRRRIIEEAEWSAAGCPTRSASARPTSKRP